MKNRFFQLLVCLFVFGLLMAIIPHQIYADGVTADFNDLKKQAEKGDISAQFRLGEIYYYGREVPQNYDQAVHWYTKAAEQGMVLAQCFLGLMYDNGDGVPQDYRQAVYWYTKAAEQGVSKAQYRLGYMYDFGAGVPKDYDKAVYWYMKAAEQGDVKAQYNLGGMHEIDAGVSQDYEQAVYWYAKSAEQGFARAQLSLGYMYYIGAGVSKDYEKAVYWYTKAAEKGEVNAQFRLGVMYAIGYGVPPNNKLAYVWSSLAALDGNEKARQYRDSIAPKLTPQLLAEAQDLAAKIQYEITHPTETSKPEPATPKKDTAYEPEIKGFGSGFIISKDGYILTCNHIINDLSKIKVKVHENLHSAKVILKDPINDLVLLKISGSFHALAFSSKRTAKMGQEVFTIGYPNPILQGINEKLTKGSINSLTGVQDDLRLYQISVPVQPGNSGGPLFDMNGNVIGIVVAMLDAKTAFKVSGSIPQNVNYAVKSTYAQALLDTLPEVSSNLLSAYKKESFDKVVDRAKKSVVMILTYE